MSVLDFYHQISSGCRQIIVTHPSFYRQDSVG